MDEIAPRIRDIRAGRVADDEWNEVAADLIQGIGDVGPLSGDARLTAMTWGMASYPAARQRLIDSGRAASDVDAMPTMAVLLTDAVREFDLARDELYKWLNLPYPDAVGPLRAAAARLEGAAQPGGRGWPFLRLLPALDRVLYNEAALQRRIAAHRCIEAMRAYAETHGAWPADLDAITDLPIPRDPVTGAPFQYRRLGPDRAELAAPHPAHERDADRLRFRLQLIP